MRKILPQIAQNSQNLLLGITSHRFHRSTQIVWVRKIVAEVSGLRSSKVPPTEYAEFTEPSAGDVLPQISRIYTDGLSAKDPPTDCTEFTEPANFRRVCQNSVNAG